MVFAAVVAEDKDTNHDEEDDTYQNANEDVRQGRNVCKKNIVTSFYVRVSKRFFTG